MRHAAVGLTGLPVAAAGAIAGYVLRIWFAIAGQQLIRQADLPVTAAALGWASAPSLLAPASLRIVLVDPLGRESAPVTISSFAL
ncbi:MAG: hypothetical protein RQ833_09320 [Sphingomonadaceae bacterium]|nr:hypothetical protein [Sphingomonadaceae bacterium]